MFTLRLLKIKIHSRRVFLFKRYLPIFAFLLTSVMIAWPALKTQKDDFAATLPTKETLKGGQTDMEEVRFFSKDSRDNPITVVADTVRETDTTRQIILMELPKATYRMADGVLLTSVTPYGMVFQQDKYFYFEENVHSDTTTGYRALSSRVVCEYEAGTLGSSSPVWIKGPVGMLQAEGFLVKEKGNWLHFKGNTATLLFQQEKPIESIEHLKFEQQKQYWEDDKNNVYITSEDGLLLNRTDKTITALKNVVVLQKSGKLLAQKAVLTYIDSADKNIQVQKMVATDNVSVTQQKQSITADEMTVYRNPAEITLVVQQLPIMDIIKTDEQPSQVIVFSGRAKMQEGIQQIKADKIVVLYDTDGSTMQKVIAMGKVVAHNGLQKIMGEYGVYMPKTKIVQVYKNVSLHEKESVLTGDYATLNLKTGMSSLSAPKNALGQSGRVKGSLIPSDFDKQEK